MSGGQLVFDINKISLLDINILIDKGHRFTIEDDLPEDEYDNVEEYIK